MDNASMRHEILCRGDLSGRPVQSIDGPISPKMQDERQQSMKMYTVGRARGCNIGRMVDRATGRVAPTSPPDVHTERELSIEWMDEL